VKNQQLFLPVFTGLKVDDISTLKLCHAKTAFLAAK
jgi:hypothetical protein